MSGMITTEFQVFTDITYLDISNNQFSGNFYGMFAGLNNLGKIMLSRNSLSQAAVSHFPFCIPFEESLLLVNNRITGSIPTEIQQFSNLGKTL